MVNSQEEIERLIAEQRKKFNSLSTADTIADTREPRATTSSDGSAQARGSVPPQKPALPERSLITEADRFKATVQTPPGNTTVSSFETDDQFFHLKVKYGR